MIAGNEIRWFSHLENSDILAWFKNHNKEFDGKKTRTDFYFLHNLTDSMSVKLREGDIEIKKRNGDRELVSLSQKCRGNIELWEKWNFELRGNKEVNNISSNNDLLWVPVEKERLALKYVFEKDGWNEIDADREIPSGIQVEYTKINCDGEVWFSFLVEWFGLEPLTLPDGFIESVTGNSVFIPEDSYGYPAFLSRVFGMTAGLK